MKKYVEVFGAVSPAASRAGDIVAALAPPAVKDALVPNKGHHSIGESVKEMLPGVAGAVAGAVMWKRHPILGLVMGHAVGTNAMELYKGDRTKALCSLAVEGAGTYAALKYGKGRTVRSVVAFVGGALAGAVATSFVDGSPAKDAWKKLAG